jgi:hypothetical protein
MALSLKPGPDPSVVGFDPDYVFVFKKDVAGVPSDEAAVTISRGDYYASVRVDQTTDFRAGTFDVKIDGLSDADWRRLAGIDSKYLYVEIKLGWRDSGSGLGAPFKSLATMIAGGSTGDRGPQTVMTGRIYEAHRVAAEFTYRAEFNGVDYRFHKLQCTKPPAAFHAAEGSAVNSYVTQLCAGVVDCKVHPSASEGPLVASPIDIDPNRSLADALQLLSQSAHADGPGNRIPLFVAPDAVHFGNWQAPLRQGTGEFTLNLSTGLVETRPLADQPSSSLCDVSPYEHKVTKYRLTLLGRPDIQLGDKVTIDPPDDDPSTTLASSVLGPLGDMATAFGTAFTGAGPGDANDFRVASVGHTVDESHSFMTQLVVERQPPQSDTEPDDATQARERDESHRSASLIASAVRRAASVALVNVGEVLRQFVRTGASPIQRVNLQMGLEPTQDANAEVRSDPSKNPTPLEAKPYLTPFAFGSTGLVIPHYPGMRVATVNYAALPQDAMLAGCLWLEDEEPESQLGDWWLSLPVDVASAESVADLNSVTKPSATDKASHDLIDAHGARSIHLRGLRVTIGQSLMPTVGTRPTDPPLDQLEIKHDQSSATIKIDSSGNIEISTTGTLTLRANKIEAIVQDSMEVKS